MPHRATTTMDPVCSPPRSRPKHTGATASSSVSANLEPSYKRQRAAPPGSLQDRRMRRGRQERTRVAGRTHSRRKGGGESKREDGSADREGEADGAKNSEARDFS